MDTSIFATYKTGENRVTASILAVLQSLSLHRIERLLGALMERSEFELVRFQNQPAKGGAGIPDASITASCRILVETKTARNAVSKEQLVRHLKRLDQATERDLVLVVLTPDESQPRAFSTLNDPRAVWASFSAFDQAIEELLDDKSDVISEREAFLPRQWQTMFSAEKLVGSTNDVVVVPGRNLWDQYVMSRSTHASYY